MKKIAIVTRRLIVGGVEKSLINMIKEMDKDRYNITLYLMGLGGILEKDLPNFVKIKNIFWEENSAKEVIKNKIKQFKVYEAIKISFYFFKAFKELNSNNYFKYENYLSKIIEKPKDEYDLVISYHAPNTFPIIYSSEFIKSKNRVLWIHGDICACQDDLQNYIEYYDKYDKIFCISEKIKYRLDKEYPYLRKKTDVFYNIINIDDIIKKSIEFKVFSDNYKGIKILTVGRLSDEKGQLIIPDIVKLAQKNGLNIRWYCIGEGVLEKQLIDRINSYRLEESIILLGNKENPYPYFKECDIYVQTSKHEGYGLTINEAKILNKPIISTNTVGGLEQIENNRNGLIVEYDANDIYKAIEKLARNDVERGRLSKALYIENKNNKDNLKKQIKKINDLIE